MLGNAFGGNLPGGKGMSITSIDCKYESDIETCQKSVKWIKGKTKLNPESHGNNVSLMNGRCKRYI